MKRVVLVGGGHAHLHVLRDAARRPWHGVDLVLISPYPRHHYSGMVPGFLQGQYREEEITFDLPSICQAAGARFVLGGADRIDADARSITVGGVHFAFDVASLDVGSAAAGSDVPGVREHAYSVWPISRAGLLRQQVDERIRSTPKGALVQVYVVGAGAAGVEVSLALHRRITLAGRRARIGLLDRGTHILPGYSAGARGRIERLLKARGIRVEGGSCIDAVEEAGVRVRGRGLLRADLVVWLTGSAAPEIFSHSNLPVDRNGYFRVGPTLQSVDGVPVWGAGDCVGLAEHPHIPKAGVYAVREAPILSHNLRAATHGGRMRSYDPQSSFLSLLNTADGKAFLRWHAATFHASWAWQLKDRIDRGFVRGYQSLYEVPAPAGARTSRGPDAETPRVAQSTPASRLAGTPKNREKQMRFENTAFAQFISSGAGRGLRIAAGLALITAGLRKRDGAGRALALVGLAPLASGTLDLCLLGPLFGGPLDGAAIRAAGGGRELAKEDS